MNKYIFLKEDVLFLGCSGKKVTMLQELINKLSDEKYFLLQKLCVDGIYGNLTKSSVMQYQAMKKMKITGKVDMATINTILNDLNLKT